MSFLMIDILPLKPGKTIDEAIAYFEKLKPVLEKHGLRRLDQPLQAQKLLRGDLAVDMVNLFEIDDPENTMKGVGADPEYQANMPLRDSLFDLPKASVILTRRRS